MNAFQHPYFSIKIIKNIFLHLNKYYPNRPFTSAVQNVLTFIYKTFGLQSHHKIRLFNLSKLYIYIYNISFNKLTL